MQSLGLLHAVCTRSVYEVVHGKSLHHSMHHDTHMINTDRNQRQNIANVRKGTLIGS